MPAAFDAGAGGYRAWLAGPAGRARAGAAWAALGRLVRPGARVLDAGCGPGRLAARAARAGARVVRLDASAAMLRGGGTAAVRADLRRPPLRRRSFDLVACHAVIEYLPDPATALAALADLVAPGGALSVLALRAGAPGDGARDRVFGLFRRGVDPAAIDRALRACGLSPRTAPAPARYLHRIGTRRP